MALHDGSDRGAADPARLACAAVDCRLQLEITGLALGTDKVAQTAAALLHSPRQHLDDGGMQAVGTGPRDPVGQQCGSNARHEKRLGCVDVAHAHHNVTGQQHLLDGGPATAQGSMKIGRRKTTIQRLDAQMTEQLGGLGRVFGWRPDHGTKAARIVQAQGALVRHQVHVVVRTRCGLMRRKVQTARHAQMQHQQPPIEVHQQILATPAHRTDRLADQALCIGSQRPPQWFAHVQLDNARAGNAVGKAAARDFNFWQFGHGAQDTKVKDCVGRRSGSLDYHATMKFRLCTAVLASCLLALGMQSATAAGQSKSPTPQSALDGPLFYQLLLGELQARQGASGAGFSLILDAARKTRDPALFQRAVDLALQARSGEAALQAAQTWKREIPGAKEPNRYILQILLALNRIEEAGQALAPSIQDLPDSEKQAAIVSIPRVFARVSDKAQAARAVESALQKSLGHPPLQASAWTTIGRMHREARQWPQAIDAALKGHASDPRAQGPLILGLSLLPQGSPEIRRMLDEAMQSPVSAELRLGYARNLIALQAHNDALQQLQRLTSQHPDFAPGWLLQGMLYLELGQAEQASQSLQQHVALAKDSTDPDQQAGLTEALMALSQLAQQRKDLQQADRWLQQLPASADPVRAAIRRAELLEQQGRADEARVVLTQVQAASPEQARRKTLALSRWMREHRQPDQAYALLEKALETSPDDHELLTELSLVMEKLKKYEDMEAVLRRLMTLRPQDPHAYNALGYSLADRNVRLEEARQWILKAVELAPQDPFIQDSLGWVEFRMGRIAEATRILQAAYQARPDAEIAAHLGEVLWSQGRKEEAARIWREGLLLKADHEVLTETMRRLGFRP